jgi:hypothetical protein
LHVRRQVRLPADPIRGPDVRGELSSNMATAPELLTCPDVGLATLRDELVARGNYFHGTNPHVIERSLDARATRIERRPP